MFIFQLVEISAPKTTGKTTSAPAATKLDEFKNDRMLLKQAKIDLQSSDKQDVKKAKKDIAGLMTKYGVSNVDLLKEAINKAQNAYADKVGALAMAAVKGRDDQTLFKQAIASNDQPAIKELMQKYNVTEQKDLELAINKGISKADKTLEIDLETKFSELTGDLAKTERSFDPNSPEFRDLINKYKGHNKDAEIDSKSTLMMEITKELVEVKKESAQTPASTESKKIAETCV